MNNKKSWIILLIVLVLLVIAGFMIFGGPNIGSLTAPIPAASTAAESSAYQAVFLVNGQVYFGKLSDQSSQFITLRDIYYLQIPQTIQPTQTKKGGSVPAVNSDPQLIKFGGELHGPSDEMRINRDQVLLLEDLRSDSNVVKAIENYQANQAKAAAAAAAKPAAE